MKVEVGRNVGVRRPDIVTRRSLIHPSEDRAQVVVNGQSLVSIQPPDYRYFGHWSPSCETDFIVVFRRKGTSRHHLYPTHWWVFTYNGDRWGEVTWDDLEYSQQAIVIRRAREHVTGYGTFSGVLPWSEEVELMVILEDM